MGISENLKNFSNTLAGKILNAGPSRAGAHAYREAMNYRRCQEHSALKSMGFNQAAYARPAVPHGQRLRPVGITRMLKSGVAQELDLLRAGGLGEVKKFARGAFWRAYPPDSRVYPGLGVNDLPRGSSEVTRFHEYGESHRKYNTAYAAKKGLLPAAPRKGLMSLARHLFHRTLDPNYLPDWETLQSRRDTARAVAALSVLPRQTPRVAVQALGGTYLSVQDAEHVAEHIRKGNPMNSDKQALEIQSPNTVETARTRMPDYMFPVPSRTREVLTSILGTVEALGGGALVESAVSSLRSSVIRTLLVSRAKVEIFLRRARELGHQLIPITSNDGGDDIFCSVRGQYILVCRDPWFPAWIEISRYIGEDNASGRITVPRLYAGRLLRYIDEAFEDTDFVQLSMMEHYGSSPIGAIPRRRLSTFHTDGKFARAAEDINAVANLRDRNTGVLLYGPPGNGKSHWIRCMAARYGIPLCNVQLRSIDDTSLIRMCINAPAAAILLMEDFDALYEGRTEALARCTTSAEAARVPTPSFSVLLNIMDGNALTRKGLVFCITTNNIDVIDPALKDRPSRFRHLLEFENPDDRILERVFLHLAPEERAQHVRLCRGQNLDQVLAYRDFKGLTPPQVERPAGARES